MSHARRAAARWRVSALGVAAALAAGSWPRAALGDEPLVKAVAVSEQEIYDDGRQGEHRFPFTPADGVDPSALTAHVTRVLVGQRPDLQRIQVFLVSAKVLPEAGPTILVKIQKPELVAKPASYELGLVLKGKARDSEVTQTVSLKLVHPAAQLRLPPTLVISRSQLPLLDLSWGDYPSTLELTEISQRSRLSGVTLRQVDEPLHQGEPVHGRVQRQTIAAIGAGWTEPAPIALSGSFPMGTTKGRLEVSAPQLEAPVLFDYEVRARAPTILVPLVFLAGVGLGQLLRGRLLKREEKLARELRASDIRDKLKRLAQRSERDAKVALQQQLQALDDAGGDEEKLDAEIVKADKLLEATRLARAEARQKLLQKLAREAAVLDRGWMLSPVMELAPVADALAEAQRRAAEDDLVEARNAERRAEEATYALARSARDWAGKLVIRLEEIERLFQPARSTFSAMIQAVRSSCAAVKAEPGSVALEPLLTAAHAANDAALQLAQQLDRALSALADEAASAARPEQADRIRVSIKPAIPSADRADAERALGHLGEDAERMLGHLTTALRALNKEVRAAVDELLPPESTGQDEVKQHLQARRYPEALKLAAQLAQAVEPEDISSFESFSAPASGGVQPMEESPTPLRGPRPSPSGGTHLIVVSNGDPATRERAALERQLRGTQAIRTWATAAVLALFTWALYHLEFIGTTRELLTLFGLGFTSDLTAARLSAAFETVKKA
ncbi:hypothetical protein [Sorangium sp. So ce117]|uniref:hypothetical protein n=1 Tax=Sorangium sp. So ce117 TaxID=3133277 RepID=UPI003F5DE83D